MLDVTGRVPRASKLYCVSVLLMTLMLLAACGTLEVRIEAPGGAREVSSPTPEVHASQAATPTSMGMTPTLTPESYESWTPAPIFTPVPAIDYPAPPGLRIVFARDGQLWSWTADTKRATALATMGQPGGDVKISDDGAIVAYLRWRDPTCLDCAQEEVDLWAVNSDGTEERLLVTAEDFEAMQPGEARAAPHQLEWVPNTHTLAFNTVQAMAFGLVLNDDLHLVDADTSEQVMLFPSGEGGEFSFSPDGGRVAIVTPGEIRLAVVGAENQQEQVLTYTPVDTGSEYRFYAQPVWAPDGSALRVAVPPTQPHVQPAERTTIWHIPTDGTPARMLTSIAAAPLVGPESLAFSPNLEYIAYIQIQQDASATPGQGEMSLEVRRLATGDWQAYPDVSTVRGWSPDSKRFAFLAGRQEPQFYIGQWSGRTIPGAVEAGKPVLDMRWVDAERYLFVTRTDAQRGVAQGGWDLVLADIYGASTVLASMDEYPRYDFVVTPSARPASPRTPPTATPVASLPGLVYWRDTGLWIDSGREQVQISDRADAILSPDGTRFLYEDKSEGNLDIWLGDRVAAHRRNLTNTPERVESNPQWWPGRLDTVLFDSRASDSPVGPGTSAFLTMVHLDGSGYQVLDGQNGVGCTLAPSPDGQTIAYGSGRTAWLYDMDTGPEVFDPASYGLESAGEMAISSPAWSPDGSMLAWVLTGVLVEGESLYHGVGVFDLQRRSATVIRGSQSGGGGACPPMPVWSPDGGWLAFESWADSPGERGLWVVPTGGQENGAESLPGTSPVWGPDGRWLAFRGSEPQNWIVQPGSWKPLALALPADAQVVDWLDLSRE